MKKLFWSFLLLIGLLSSATAIAQQVPFSMYLYHDVFFNPSLVGTSAKGMRFHTVYKRQWSSIPNAYNVVWTGFDAYLKSLKSGIGVAFLNQGIQGFGLQTNQVSLYYAYHLRMLGDSRLSFGLGVLYANERLGINGLRFGDQIEQNTSQSAEAISQFQQNTLTFSIGMNFQRPHFLLGVTVKDLNRFERTQGTTQSSYPIYLSAQGRYRHDLGRSKRKQKTLDVFAIYHQQSTFQEIQVGVQMYYQPMILGLSYQLLPSKVTAPSYALVTAIGFHHKKITFVYGYDLNYGALVRLTGSHELTLTVEFGNSSFNMKKANKFSTRNR